VYEDQVRVLWGEDVGAGRSRHAAYVRLSDRWFVASHLERVDEDETLLVEQFIDAPRPATTRAAATGPIAYSSGIVRPVRDLADRGAASRFL
jgi:hypothetical protein